MKIKLLVMDVDGTLTDGRIYIGADGEVMKAFDVKDGYAISNFLPEFGIVPVIITGRKSKIVEQRAQELKITQLYQGIEDKLAKLKELASSMGISREEIAYIGDDLNDMECIQWCGLSAAPADSITEILQQADFICHNNGGRGAVREFVHMIITKNEASHE